MVRVRKRIGRVVGSGEEVIVTSEAAMVDFAAFGEPQGDWDELKQRITEIAPAPQRDFVLEIGGEFYQIKVTGNTFVYHRIVKEGEA